MDIGKSNSLCEHLDVLLVQRADEAIYHLAQRLEALLLKLIVKVVQKQEDTDADTNTSLD